MAVITQLIMASVFHKRLIPREHKFKYDVYYLALPLSQIKDKKIRTKLALNKMGLISFYEKDHGDRKGASLERWVRNI